MSEPSQAIVQLLRDDPRYKFEAYAFVFEALSYAHNKLGMGGHGPAGQGPGDEDEDEDSDEQRAERHITGQQLCEAIRQYALDQYGYMAKIVLNNLGVHETGDFGEIVFNLIRIGSMRKTEADRREDFDDVFDFETDLRQGFRITLPE